MDEVVSAPADEMASSSRGGICDLPNELLLCVFSFLPVAGLAQCAFTCQQWRDLVTGYSHLWKGKLYGSGSRPTACAKTRTVLSALPHLRQVTIRSSPSHFRVLLWFPSLLLWVKCTSFLNDCPTLRCEYLSASLDVASYILYSQKVVDLESLQRLCVERMEHPDSRALGIYSADHVVREALRLCPNLRHLNVSTDFESAENLETLEGLGRLQTLVLASPGLQKLSFLRLCSAALESLTLVKCRSLPPQEFAQLGQLQNLRSLRLTDCCFQEGDLVSAVASLGLLESLQLERCSCVRDLSALCSCGRLWELRVTRSTAPRRRLWRQLHQLQLCQLRPLTQEDGRSLRTVAVDAAVSVLDLPAALAELRRAGLSGSCVAYLAALRHCPRLRYVCCEFVHDGPEHPDVQLHIILTRPT